MKNFIDLSGKRFHRLVVIAPAGKSKNNSFLFLCRCDCGIEVVKRATHLQRGEVKSCGCFRREDSRLRGCKMKKHGMCFTPTYESWSAMKFRCTNPNHVAFPQYGGRGIKICPQWNKFENFLADMGERPNGKTLDRIDANGDYTPENCRWATRKEQSRNIRTNHVLTFLGQTLTLAEWSERTGFNYTTLKERLRRGWTTERTLTSPCK